MNAINNRVQRLVRHIVTIMNHVFFLAISQESLEVKPALSFIQALLSIIQKNIVTHSLRNSFNTRASRATRTRKQLVPRLSNSCHGFSTRAAT